MKIIHISDLHFGTLLGAIDHILLQEIKTQKPDLIIISGDFAQNGTQEEFHAAQHFLQNLPCQYLCVPGNHDVPAHNLWERFMTPYKKYKQYITSDFTPFLETDQAVIAGLNSARRALPHWNWANGALSASQRQHLRSIYAPLQEQDDGRWRICTFHHPIHKVDDMPLDVTVFGRKAMLQTLQDLQIDLVLTGHVHHASITMRGDGNHQTIYLSASTAMSSRLRSQENGFNVITLSGDKMKIEILKLQNDHFKTAETLERTKTA